jgi:hypothetical protein
MPDRKIRTFLRWQPKQVRYHSKGKGKTLPRGRDQADTARCAAKKVDSVIRLVGVFAHRGFQLARLKIRVPSSLATAVTFAFPNWPKSDDGLSYSTAVLTSSV